MGIPVVRTIPGANDRIALGNKRLLDEHGICSRAGSGHEPGGRLLPPVRLVTA